MDEIVLSDSGRGGVDDVRLTPTPYPGFRPVLFSIKKEVLTQSHLNLREMMEVSLTGNHLLSCLKVPIHGRDDINKTSRGVKPVEIPLRKEDPAQSFLMGFTLILLPWMNFWDKLCHHGVQYN